MKRSRWLVVTVCLFFGAGLWLLHAQAPATQQPTFRVEANFVRVDAYPTRNGQPVLDLGLNDFELFEDGRPQRIETFEHVQIRGANPQAERVEPATVGEANTLAANPRNRVFVLFLDTYHVENGSSRNIRDALVKTLDRIIAPDDLVGVMTPEMSAADLTLARKTTTIDGILTRAWTWGRRDDVAYRDPEEGAYEACYPPEFGDRNSSSAVATEMIERRREKLSLDALTDLVVHLHGLREERKAILTISDGWRLFMPNPALMQADRRRPVIPGIGVSPRGQPTTKDERDGQALSRDQCQTDLMRLAQLDNDRTFRDLLDEANRANASFYSIDPRGLPVFDTSMGGPGRLLSPSADSAQLGKRLQALRTLAGATDGLAVIGSNDLESGLRRIVADLNSYYLLGYYSDSGKLDGKFRSIRVAVTRPGVDVRARRGYRAATEAEVRTVAPPHAASPLPAANAPILEAVSALASIRPDSQLRLRVAWTTAHASADANGPPEGLVWLIGEIGTDLTPWSAGGTATVVLVNAKGSTVTQSRVAIQPAKRLFVAEMKAPALAPGDYIVQVRAVPRDGEPLQEIARLSIASSAQPMGQPLVLRRGPFANQPFEPTADMRFRRNERLRIEWATDGHDVAFSAQLFDRAGTRLAIPLATSEREDARVGRWLAAELALAPLGAGDYVVQCAAGPDNEDTTAVAFRVVP